MTDDILPLLKPADWNLASDMVCRPLAEFPSPGMPYVAYGYDRPNTFEILGRANADAATTASLEAPALKHLRARNASWEKVEIKTGWFKKVRILICGDDFLAAERILDVEFLRAAQKQLGAKMLAVGIPRRGLLMVSDGAQSKDNLQRFCAAVAGQYHRAETPPITTTVFGVIDGSIVGHLQDGGVADNIKPAIAAEVAADDSIYVQTLTFDKDGARRAVICAGGAPLDRVEARIRREVASLIAKYGATLQAEVSIIPDLTPRTPEVDAWMPRLATGLTGLVTELRAPHEVRVTYGQPTP
jgi:hypothetical protein